MVTFAGGVLCYTQDDENNHLEVTPYIRHCHKNGGRKFTIVMAQIDSAYRVGIAVLHPADKNYNKEMGRNIAMGRIFKRPISYVHEDTVKELGIRDVLEHLEDFFLNEKNMKKTIAMIGECGCQQIRQLREMMDVGIGK